MFSVYFYLYILKIILSNSMATAESIVSKYPYLKFLWYLYCFLFTIYWFRHSTTILSKGLSKLIDNGIQADR